MSKSDSPDPAAMLPPLALIAGPTASGKSDCAVRLALELKQDGREGVVVNADASQVYADLAVLSARPTGREMRGVDHRLFGVWDGAYACSAADWADAAREEIAEIHAAGSVPVLVGGTGLYIRTLLEGIAPIPAIDPAIREQVRALPLSDAYRTLAVEDPDRAAALNPGDIARIKRALEVVRSTGRPLSYWQAHKEGGISGQAEIHGLVLLPDREWLYERCNRRFALMLDHGAIEEVERLLARGLDPALPVMRAIGVPEIAGMLRGEWDRAEAIARAAQATRNYAKRQYTWLRHQVPEEWPRIMPENFDPVKHFARLFHN